MQFSPAKGHQLRLILVVIVVVRAALAVGFVRDFRIRDELGQLRGNVESCPKRRSFFW